MNSGKNEYRYDHIVNKYISLLSEEMFNVVEQRNSEQAFGNLLIEMCSTTICCRLIRDRGQWFIDVKGISSSRWHDLILLRELITGYKYDIRWSIEDQLQFLASHMPDINARFANDSIQRTEDQLHSMRDRL